MKKNFARLYNKFDKTPANKTKHLKLVVKELDLEDLKYQNKVLDDHKKAFLKAKVKQFNLTRDPTQKKQTLKDTKNHLATLRRYFRDDKRFDLKEKVKALERENNTLEEEKKTQPKFFCQIQNKACIQNKKEKLPANYEVPSQCKSNCTTNKTFYSSTYAPAFTAAKKLNTFIQKLRLRGVEVPTFVLKGFWDMSNKQLQQLDKLKEYLVGEKNMWTACLKLRKMSKQYINLVERLRRKKINLDSLPPNFDLFIKDLIPKVIKARGSSDLHPLQNMNHTISKLINRYQAFSDKHRSKLGLKGKQVTSTK
tara:strand:+ start:151 stop:1077 length:927 start_codon:yes stop_codon:yes gene_type:complete